MDKPMENNMETGIVEQLGDCKDLNNCHLAFEVYFRRHIP